VSLKEITMFVSTVSKIRIFRFSQIVIYSHSCPEETTSDSLCFLQYLTTLLQLSIIPSTSLRAIPCTGFVNIATKTPVPVSPQRRNSHHSYGSRLYAFCSDV